MRTYFFRGASTSFIEAEGLFYSIKSLDCGIGFEAKVSGNGLKMALAVLDSVLKDCSYTLDSVYTVVNERDQTSVRILRNPIFRTGGKGSV